MMQSVTLILLIKTEQC